MQTEMEQFHFQSPKEGPATVTPSLSRRSSGASSTGTNAGVGSVTPEFGAKTPNFGSPTTPRFGSVFGSPSTPDFPPLTPDFDAFDNAPRRKNGGFLFQPRKRTGVCIVNMPHRCSPGCTHDHGFMS